MTDLVPVVDLRASDAPDRVDAACRTVGFMSVVGHGVPPDVIETMVEATDEFFALPLEEKLRYQSPSAEINRGYAAQGTEGLTYSLGVGDRPPDLFEAFNIGPDHVPAGAPSDRPEFAPNIWPERPAGLRHGLVAYFAAVSGLTRRITEVMALALGLDRRFFADKTDHSTETLRVNHYERRAGEPGPPPASNAWAPTPTTAS
jgi:isopenicillin N synthase-like dioxygenase